MLANNLLEFFREAADQPVRDSRIFGNPWQKDPGCGIPVSGHNLFARTHELLGHLATADRIDVLLQSVNRASDALAERRTGDHPDQRLQDVRGQTA
jgi:hypothetical protein